MAQRSVEFTFKQIGCQGVHISTYTPSRLSDYTEKIAIPAESGYHVVGCYLPFLISNMNSWNIVERYMEVSERHPRTIIDVCLPYHDLKSRKTFMGRYIFFAGLLVGIRVNTNASEMVPYYSSWPKHKTKVIVFSMGKQEKQEILLGEFSLKLINARVGLLFQSQLRTSANQYMNYGYDILVLTYESIQPESKLLAIKNDLSKKAYVIDSYVGNFESKIDSERIAEVSEEGRREQKDIIYVDYYDLKKIFKLKQYISPSSNKTCQIAPITINLMLNQQNNLKKHDKSSQDLLLRYKIASRFKEPQNTQRKLCQDSSIDIFIKRLYKLFLLADFKKIILIIQESPAILCFLYIVKNFVSIIQKTRPNFQASQMFSIINLHNFRFNLLAQKFVVFPSKSDQDSQQECKDNLEIKIMSHFNEIMQSQKDQEFFVVITPNQRILNIVKLLNQRQNINLKHHFNLNQSLSGSNSSEFINRSQIVLKTWMGCDFFTPEELKDLYFGCTIKSVVEDRQYFGQLWLKYINIETVFKRDNAKRIEDVIDLNLNQIEINGIFTGLNLSEMLKQTNLIVFQFKKLITELEERGCYGWQNGLFSHFLFRKINTITYFTQPDYVLKGTRNFLLELAILDKQTILPTFLLVTFYNFSLNDRLQHRLALRKIAQIRQQNSTKQQCHSCLHSYPNSLIYQCKTLICREYFCYSCLIETKSIQPHEIKKKNTPNQEVYFISRCPACKGLCDLGCKRCEIKSICCKMRKKQGVKTGRRECHFCLKQNAVNYYNCSNVDCRRLFCSKCIEEYYRDRSREYQNSEWHCYVCQERCNCNNCEVQKATIRKVINKIEMKKEIEKELDRTKGKEAQKGKACEIAINLIEEPQEQDKGVDASYIDVNEASTMLPKEFPINLANSFGLAQEKKIPMTERSVLDIEEVEPALWIKGDLERNGGKIGLKPTKQSQNKKIMLITKKKGLQTTEKAGMEPTAFNKTVQRAIKLEQQENRSAQLPPNPLQKSTISTKSTDNSASRLTKPSIALLGSKIKTKPLTFDFAQPLSGRQFDY